MADAQELTFAYMNRHPVSAGRVLSSLPPGDVAVFLETVAVKDAVRPLSKMNPRTVSLIIREMKVADGASLLGELGFAHAASILRQIAPDGRAALLQEMPRRLRRDFERSMVFPVGTVGAHMTTNVVALAVTETAGSALEFIRQLDQRQGDVVFVVNDSRKLLGAVTLTRLLRYPGRTPLGEVLDRTCASVSAHARLPAIAALDDWQEYSRLPVVSRSDELIGSISRKSMLRVSRGEHDGHGVGGPSLPQAMAGAITATTAGLVDLFVRPSARLSAVEKNDE